MNQPFPIGAGSGGMDGGVMRGGTPLGFMNGGDGFPW